MNEKLGTIHELRIDEGLGQNYAMAPVYEELPRHLTFHAIKCICHDGGFIFQCLFLQHTYKELYF